MSNLSIRKGKTYTHTIRWGGEPIVYKPITGIDKSAPMRVHVPGHGLVDGWPAAIVSAQGMVEANARNDPPAASDYHQAKIIGAGIVEFNRVNAAGFRTYRGGGYLMYYTPIDLEGMAPRMVIRDRVGGTVIATSDAERGGAAEIVLAVDLALKKIAFTLAAEVTAAINAKTAVFEVEIADSLGDMHYLDGGSIAFTEEIAT